MIDFGGWDMPVQYTGIIEEHLACRNKVGLFDVSHMGEVRFRGPHALAAVQYLVTNDVSKLADGQAMYTAMCNEQGGIVDDLIVYRFGPEEILICVNAANRAKEDLRRQVSVLAVAGAEKLIRREIDGNVHKTLLDELAAEI